MGYLKVEIEGIFDSENLTSGLSTTGKKFVRGKMFIPMINQNTGEEYRRQISFSAWEKEAELIENWPEGVPAKVTGTLRTSTYDRKCRSCGTPNKNYWTEVVITDIDI